MSNQSKSMHIVGTIHPTPPVVGRYEIDDLTRREIQTTRLGASATSHAHPILEEHDGGPVGTVITSWRASDGRLKMAGVVENSDVASRVRSGELRGLSIGSQVHHKHGGNPLDEGSRVLHSIHEVSLCKEPRRPGCYVEEINGVPVSISAHASGTQPSHVSFERSYKVYTALCLMNHPQPLLRKQI